ncbi:DUF5693 family protein [Geochorda subterranea]|uniref:DUF5693 family protein n=1 Tax=Geochorda subterranea TaxID=3109564 RepID=A0ABZ1BMD9_9FIRM|nr:DUF5693 family protein [Limnochorda sp. LNt]WRP13937.1 DUF5693 family protein [Limnochorda sp. LNt]
MLVLLRYADRPRIEPWAFAPADPAAATAAGTGPTTPAISRVLIFEGSSVPDPAAVAGPMRRAGLALGLVEFAGQQGAPELARRLDLAAVGVHSMRAEEMAASTVDDAVARYVRAVRERGARVLYLRPAATADETVALVREMAGALEREGRVVAGRARAGAARPPAWLLALVGVGAGGLAAWAWEGWRAAARRPGGWMPLAAVLAGSRAGPRWPGHGRAAGRRPSPCCSGRLRPWVSPWSLRWRRPERPPPWPRRTGAAGGRRRGRWGAGRLRGHRRGGRADGGGPAQRRPLRAAPRAV